MEHNQHLDNLLSSKFAGIPLRSPLFYSASIGIRFELGGNINNLDKRAEQIKKRATTLFHALNREDDNIYFVLFMDSWAEHPTTAFEKDVRRVFGNVVRGIDLEQISKCEQEFRYKDPDDVDDIVTIRYCAKVQARDLKAESLFTGIANRTVGLEPSIVGDIFLINETNKTIFHLYDDRGLDIVAENTEVLKTVYAQYNHWILDYDRDRIDEIFS